MASTIVVGGGVSGLLCAWRLAQAGDSVTLIERGALGGSIRSADIGGFVGDVGAESFAITRPEAAALVDELGLASVAPARSDARLVLPDLVAPLPDATILGIPGRLDAGDVRCILSPDDTGQAIALDAMPVQDLPTSLGELVRVRMGEAVVRRLVDPVVSGVHAVSADSVDADTVAPGLRAAVARGGSLAAAVRALRGSGGAAGAPVRSLPGGMGGLIVALEREAADSGVRMLHGCEVTAARRDAAVRRGSEWTVATTTGEVSAHRVVLAVPTTAAAGIVGMSDPALATLLSQGPLGDVVVIALHLRSRQLDVAPVGSGALIARDVVGVAAKGMTHASAKWSWIAEALPPSHHIVRLSFGRDGGDPWAALGLDPVARAVADVRSITGATDLEVVGSVVQPWPQSLSHPLPGQVAWRSRVRESLPIGLHVLGPGISGNGIAGAVADVDALLTTLSA